MFDVQAVSHSFGRAADVYDANARLQAHVRSHCLTLAKSYWTKDARILDAGCGTGALFAEAAPHHWRITGLDVSAGMCAIASKRGTAIHADTASMPFADTSFDGVFSSLMLQWLNSPQAAFGEMARVMKPGTVAVLSTLAEGTLDELRAAFSMIDDRPHVSDFLTPHAVLEHASAAGFSLVKAQQSAVVEYYPDTVALMRSLKNIGATNAQASRPRGLMTPRQLAVLEQAYTKHERGLPATWQVLYLVLRKE